MPGYISCIKHVWSNLSWVVKTWQYDWLHISTCCTGSDNGTFREEWVRSEENTKTLHFVGLKLHKPLFCNGGSTSVPFYFLTFQLKELSLFYKLKFFNLYIFATQRFELWYFELRLFDLTEIIAWNIEGLQYCIAKI